jgi:hypothetical protein
MAALWFVLDMDDGVIAVGRTRREAMRLATMPTRAEWRGAGPWEHHRYGPDSEEIVWFHHGDDDASSAFIEHGHEAVLAGGWGWALEAWRAQGSPVGVRIDETEGCPRSPR